MFSRYIDKCDFSSRFRILKGGKVSLVVSAMLVSSLVNVGNAATIDFEGNTPYIATLSTLTGDTVLNINGPVSTTTTAVEINSDNTAWINVENHSTFTVTANTGSGSSVSGINIYNLSPANGGAGSSVTNSGQINISNTGEAYGITSSTANPIAGNWDGMKIINDGTMSISGVGYSEAIFVDGDFKNGSITNNATKSITVSSTDVTTETYGIDIGHKFISSSIDNNGTINSTSKKTSYGIYLDNDAENSQIKNSGEINTSSTSTITRASNITDALTLSSTGMRLSRVISTGTLDNNSNVENSGAMNVEAISNITTAGTISAKDITTNATGIYLNFLNGQQAGLIPSLQNSDSINVTSKINFDFVNQGDSIDSRISSNPIYALAKGFEISSTDQAGIANTGTLTSLAQIDVNAKGTVTGYSLYAESQGIKMWAPLDNSMLINQGTIDSRATFNGTNDANANAYGIALNDVNNSEITLGRITTKAEGTSINPLSRAYVEAKGLIIDANINISLANIKNNSLMDVKSIATSDLNSFSYARGIDLQGTMDLTMIKNELGAEIRVNAEALQSAVTGNTYSEAEAYGISVSDFANSMILNNGTIDVVAKATSYNNSNVSVYGMSINSRNPVNSLSITPPIYSIENTGNIKANAYAVVTDTTVSPDVSAYGIYASFYVSSGNLFTITNSGTVEAYINDKLDRDAYSLNIGGESDYITVSNSGTLKGNINVNGTLINSGTIELAHNANATDEYNAYIRKFENTGTGVLRIGLLTNGTLEGTSYSQLNTDTATFNDGSTIDVNVLSASTNVGLLAGNTLRNVVSSDTLLTIDGKLNITDNSELLNFEYIQDGNNIDLKAVKGSSNNIVDSTIAGGGQITSQNAARALQFIQDDGENHHSMDSVFAKLNSLHTSEEVAHAVATTTPQSSTSSSTAASQISSSISNVVMQRQNPTFSSLTSSGLSSGDEVVQDKNLWIKPYGSIGSQGNKDGMNGFDVKSYGLGMGFDSKNKAEQMVGFGLFFTDANVDMKNVSQETDIKAYSMMVYGSLPVIDNKTNLLYQVGYGLQQTDSKRDLFTQDRAIADYTSKMASVDLRLVRDYQLTNNLLLQPLVSTTYRNFKTPSYSETGAGALNLDVDKTSTSEMVVGLGTIATYKLNSKDKLIGSLNVGYDLKDDKNMVVSSYQGASVASFETQGIDNGRWSYDAGIGYEKAIDSKNSISVNYNFQGEGSDYTNNVVSANYVLKF